jgi:hypothetical protein
MSENNQKSVQKAWRPSSISSEVTSKLKNCFQRDFSVVEACAHVGISTKAYYRKYKKDKQFRGDMDNAKQTSQWLAKSKYFDALNSSDPWLSFKAALEFLKHRNPDWKEKQGDITINNNMWFTSIEIIDATGKQTSSTTNTETTGTSEELSG